MSWTVLSGKPSLCLNFNNLPKGESMSINTLLAGKTLGFGTAPLGNMFRDIPEAEAQATVDAAWEQAPATSIPPRSMAQAWPRSALATRWPSATAMTSCSAPRSAA